MARLSAKHRETEERGDNLVAAANREAEECDTLLAESDEIPDQERQRVWLMTDIAQALLQAARNRAVNLVDEFSKAA